MTWISHACRNGPRIFENNDSTRAPLVLVIGGGVAGCCVTRRLSDAGVSVVLTEKASVIGGKVRKYGCKATDKCRNCGLCLVGGLWENIEKNPLTEIMTSSVLTDLREGEDGYDALVDAPAGQRRLRGLKAVVVSTGFEEGGFSSHFHIEGREGIVSGLELEEMTRLRSPSGLFAVPPESVAFLQCFGSRDAKERAFYCSKVCCSYASRMARVLRHYYPHCAVTFFYMELQSVSNSYVFEELKRLGVRFVKCRPLKVTGGRPAAVEYNDPARGAAKEHFDLVVRSVGIHPASDNGRIAALCGLEQDEHGFLRNPSVFDNGIYVTGCAKRPLTICETCHDSDSAASAILARLSAEEFRPGKEARAS